MKYQVEFRSASNTMWALDDEFESLGEAMSHATSEALLNPDWEHRVIQRVTVMTYPRLEDFV